MGMNIFTDDNAETPEETGEMFSRSNVLKALPFMQAALAMDAANRNGDRFGQSALQGMRGFLEGAIQGQHLNSQDKMAQANREWLEKERGRKQTGWDREDEAYQAQQAYLNSLPEGERNKVYAMGGLQNYLQQQQLDQLFPLKLMQLKAQIANNQPSVVPVTPQVGFNFGSTGGNEMGVPAETGSGDRRGQALQRQIDMIGNYSFDNSLRQRLGGR